jgi:hypothetical protein
MLSEYYKLEKIGRLNYAISVIRDKFGHESFLTTGEFLKEILKMNESKKPAARAYQVRDNKDPDKKANWLEIGAAWAHKDGKGFDILLQSIPLDGRIVLRAIEDKPEKTEG